MHAADCRGWAPQPGQTARDPLAQKEMSPSKTTGSVSLEYTKKTDEHLSSQAYQAVETALTEEGTYLACGYPLGPWHPHMMTSLTAVLGLAPKHCQEQLIPPLTPKSL